MLRIIIILNVLYLQCPCEIPLTWCQRFKSASLSPPSKWLTEFWFDWKRLVLTASVCSWLPSLVSANCTLADVAAADLFDFPISQKNTFPNTRRFCFGFFFVLIRTQTKCFNYKCILWNVSLFFFLFLLQSFDNYTDECAIGQLK